MTTEAGMYSHAEPNRRPEAPTNDRTVAGQQSKPQCDRQKSGTHRSVNIPLENIEFAGGKRQNDNTSGGGDYDNNSGEKNPEPNYGSNDNNDDDIDVPF